MRTIVSKGGRHLLAAGTVLILLAYCTAQGGALWSGAAKAAPAGGATLVMFESPICEYCELWDEEIGVVYNRTPEGRFAPLRRVTKDRDAHGIRNLRAIIYTPTFVVVKDGREVGRITGYPGEDFFWPMLADILELVGYEQLH